MTEAEPAATKTDSEVTPAQLAAIARGMGWRVHKSFAYGRVWVDNPVKGYSCFDPEHDNADAFAVMVALRLDVDQSDGRSGVIRGYVEQGGHHRAYRILARFRLDCDDREAALRTAIYDAAVKVVGCE